MSKTLPSFNIMCKPVCGRCNLDCAYCYYTMKPEELYPGVKQFRMSDEVLESYTRQYLEAQISRFGGNISRTAGFVGMERSALHRKLRSLGIAPGERH